MKKAEDDNEISFYIHQIRKIFKSDSSKCWRKYGAMGAPLTAGGSMNWYNHFGKQFDSILQNRI